MAGTIDGKHGDHVILAPPYVCTAAEIGLFVVRFGVAVVAAMAGL